MAAAPLTPSETAMSDESGNSFSREQNSNPTRRTAPRLVGVGDAQGVVAPALLGDAPLLPPLPPRPRAAGLAAAAHQP